ncbi:ribonuclease HI [Aureicoccus marinus]|uniref:ribonuclease H n=1 Tax=Aureicoccus marinus TaxID=754435 RepID=A0A2S7TA36_9FLAO|nr:ribonuclease HI [Aureicoccus marinus]
MKPEVLIYTDGAARGNPGPGGYGIVMEWAGKNYRKEFSQGYRYTTNNRMELLAVIEALRKLKRPGVRIVVYTDSRYVSDAVEKRWLFGWEKKNFKDKKNPDLWREFLIEYRKHQVSFVWVKGHNNHPQNERCDALAVAASHSKDLLEDVGFTAGGGPN